MTTATWIVIGIAVALLWEIADELGKIRKIFEAKSIRKTLRRMP